MKIREIQMSKELIKWIKDNKLQGKSIAELLRICPNNLKHELENLNSDFIIHS